MASLQVEKKHICGGTVVNQNFILTAAHCLHGLTTNDLVISLGSDLIQDVSAKKVKAQQFYVHPLYKDGEAYFDVALLELTSPLQFDAKIYPICLPEVAGSNENARANQGVTLTGWGSLERSGTPSEKLRQAQLSIFSQQYCNRTHTVQGGLAGLRIKSALPALFQPNLMCAGYQVR